MIENVHLRSESEHQSWLLERARAGGVSELGNLLNLYGNYLKLLAQSQLDRRLTRRVSPSDLVQDTMLEAHRDFGQFRGNTIGELVAWLRKILVNNLIHASEKHFGAEKRDIRREMSLQQACGAVERSHSQFELFVEDRVGSPSSEVCRIERMRLLADAIAQLPKDQRCVVVLRHMDKLQFSEIAKEIDRSSGACRMLWMRAMDSLREVLTRQGLE